MYRSVEVIQYERLFRKKYGRETLFGPFHTRESQEVQRDSMLHEKGSSAGLNAMQNRIIITDAG